LAIKSKEDQIEKTEAMKSNNQVRVVSQTRSSKAGVNLEEDYE
jgi:hypothetical protein